MTVRPVTLTDMQPDEFGMQALDDLRKRAAANGLTSKPSTLGPPPKPGEPTMRFCPIRNCFVKNDGSDDIRVAMPPPGLQERLQEIRARHQVVVEAREAEAAAAEAERNRIANLEARIAQLEAERKEPAE